MKNDLKFLRLALRLARRGHGATSPNPMVGAVLAKGGRILGRGWHRRAGLPHAEIEALHDAQRRGRDPRGATLYVTIEPCCTRGRTPPCTEAVIAAGIKRVVIGTADPNPRHSGRAFNILRRAGIEVDAFSAAAPRQSAAIHSGNEDSRQSSEMPLRKKIAAECAQLNEAFNHWIVHRTPFVTVKAAMSLDGKIATAGGESKWITGAKARAFAMKLRHGADAVLVGVNTILADDPGLTARTRMPGGRWKIAKPLRRIVLDSLARTPLRARIVSDGFAAWTTIVVSRRAPKRRVRALAKRAGVWIAPITRTPTASGNPQIDPGWLLEKLGAQNVASLLVEGGGEVNASFLLGGFARRVAFFYAPKILGGRDARKAVAGEGAKQLQDAIRLCDVEWKRMGGDLMMTARTI